MPGSVSESHKIGGPRNSRVRENCCIDSNNRDVARRLISVRWLGDNWGVIAPTRQEPVHYLLSFGINSLVTCLTLLVNNVFINSSRPTPS